MRNLRLVSVLAVLTSALALSACGGGGGGNDTKSAAQKKSNAPIEDQLGFDQAGLMARESRAEDAIRDCMKSQGFDYVPVDPFAQRAALLGSSRISDQDFLKQYGYGISTLWGRGKPQADPNERLRATLGAADRRAYSRALWGDNPGATFQQAVENGDFTKLGGCTKKATEQVFGGAALLTRLQGKLDQLDDRVSEDQRMVRAVEKWSQCMAKQGYRYDDPDAIDSDLFKRTEAIVGPLPGQFATGPPPGDPPRPYNHAALAQLQRDEVSIARADNSCEHKDITPVEDVVRPQYEAQFRQRNQNLIAQVRPVR